MDRYALTHGSWSYRAAKAVPSNSTDALAWQFGPTQVEAGIAFFIVGDSRGANKGFPTLRGGRGFCSNVASRYYLHASSMQVFYTRRYYADIGATHIFPIRKFELVRDRLLEDGTLRPDQIVEPAPATREQALLVHTEDYVSRLCSGNLTPKEIRRLGLPWSESLVQRSFYAVGGTIAAANVALDEGFSSNLAGGTHHSFADRGEGFCVLNDVAIAIRTLRKSGRIRRATIIDCDVHQGNGTATIFANDPATYTFSIHGANNYPLFKANSNLDVELPDGTSDETYLNTLAQSLPTVFAERSDIVFYLAGADPYSGDKLGRLALSIAGLRKRDEFVLRQCYQHELPVVTVMSGGYGKDLGDTIEIHCNTIRATKGIFETQFSNARTAMG